MSNNGGVYTWSQVAANNASADNTVNFAEGQAPSSINDSARALMTSVAKYRDDISGAIVTGGISVAYTVASNQQFDTLANFHQKTIAFTPHVTNGVGPVTMTVDGFANLPLRTAPGAELLAGVLIQGTPYVAVYNNTDGALYLQGGFGNAYNVPFLGGMDYWDTITPNSAFIFPMGQAISRTTYAKAYARWGTKFGAGDGSTTFNVPDKSGRVSAMTESAASRLSASYFGGNSTVIGAVGGADNHALTANEMPSHYHSASIYDPGHAHGVSGGTLGGTGQINIQQGAATYVLYGAAGIAINAATTGVRVNSSNGLDTTYSAGGSAAHAIVQPTITCNYIIRIA